MDPQWRRFLTSPRADAHEESSLVRLDVPWRGGYVAIFFGSGDSRVNLQLLASGRSGGRGGATAGGGEGRYWRQPEVGKKKERRRSTKEPTSKEGNASELRYGEKCGSSCSGRPEAQSPPSRRAGAETRRGGLHVYIAFRAVCSGWRACTPSPRDPTLRIRTLRPVAWVALCDGDSVRPDDACEVTLFNCQTARCLRVRLPDDLRRPRYRIIGFTDGLVILLHKRSTAIRVLHPFTRVVVDFPSLAPVYQQLIRNRNSVINMSAAVCPSVSSPATSIAVVVWFPYPVSSLGSRALFLSIDRCLSVSAKDLPSNSSDSLYLSIPLPYPGFLYSIRSRSIERPTMFSQVHDLEKRVRPSVRPFTLADHLLTYCNHRQW
ncbi:uncharacterized protein LOC112268689 [Brachypodium distachyon]|uniref:uncharacterized protein LOC112268689 n=1 Tax=Brachypodium distachyon TaxID=15368 RepID=UPI000D0DA0BE|nr:uncharacterized protein LOC112268689 [Brachypodium distachyon]|eukprot:XP_024310408.1 uncharacterized protein LOC112268689 [Brachypodium distachyon]